MSVVTSFAAVLASFHTRAAFLQHCKASQSLYTVMPNNVRVGFVSQNECVRVCLCVSTMVLTVRYVLRGSHKYGYGFDVSFISIINYYDQVKL